MSEEEYIDLIKLNRAETQALEEGEIDQFVKLFKTLKQEKEEILGKTNKETETKKIEILEKNQVVDDLYIRNELTLTHKERDLKLLKSIVESIKDKDKQDD